MKKLCALLTLATAGWLAAGAAAAEIELLVRADDMGVAQSVNEACVASWRDGVVRSVEVIVPGPWFPHAVKLLREAPGLDVGVHLTLTSEWENCKWRPLTHAPSLVDSEGYFFPMTSQRKDFPPGTGFLQSGFKMVEVERELRAQIEMARRLLPGVSHLSAHMGAATATPALKELTRRLAAEHGLVLEMEGLGYARGFRGGSAAEREASLVELVGKLQPGRWLLVEHPAYDTPEARGLGHFGYENVAEDRAGVTAAFLSGRVKEAVAARGVRLISYRDLKPAAAEPAK